MGQYKDFKNCKVSWRTVFLSGLNCSFVAILTLVCQFANGLRYRQFAEEGFDSAGSFPEKAGSRHNDTAKQTFCQFMRYSVSVVC